MKFKHLLFFFTVLSLAILASACTGGGAVASSWPGLTINGDYAYVASGTQIYTVALSNGIEKTRYPEKPDSKISYYASPAFTPDGQIIIGGYDHVLYSLNPTNNQQNWLFKDAKNRYIAAALVTDKAIFAPNSDGTLYALNLNGVKKWSFKTKGALWATPVFDSQCNCLYLSSMDHHIYALNPDTGVELWNSVDLGGAVVGSPALNSDGTLYIGSFGDNLQAISAKDGSFVWAKPIITGGWVWSGPALADGKLYFGDLGGNFYAVDASNGTILWQLKPNQLDGPISGTPVVKDNLVYFTTELGFLFSVDTTGNIESLKKYTVEGKLYAGPVVSGELILVTPSGKGNQLVAFTKDGAIQWQFNPNPAK